MEQTERAVEEGVFDPQPGRFGSLAEYHVTFSELTGDGLEGRVGNALLREDNVAIIGKSGGGKSSLMSWIGRDRADELALLRVPITLLSEDVLHDPRAVTGHILGQLRHDARKILTVKDDQPRLQRLQATLGVQWMGIGFATEVEAQLADAEPRSSQADQEVLQSLLNQIRPKIPILVFDDTDRWTARTTFRDAQMARESFFGRSLRSMADDLDAVFLAAVHEDYLDDDDADRILAPFSTRAAIPTLTRNQLRRLLERRSGAADVALPDLFEHDGLDAVLDAYEHGSVRAVLRLAHNALQYAMEAASKVTSEVIATVRIEVDLV